MTSPLSCVEQQCVIDGLLAVQAKNALEIEDLVSVRTDLEGQVFDLKERVKLLEDAAAKNTEREACELAGVEHGDPARDREALAKVTQDYVALDRLHDRTLGNVRDLHATVGRLECKVSALRLGIRAALQPDDLNDEGLVQDLWCLLREDT